jgi:hypothetical protein
MKLSRIVSICALICIVKLHTTPTYEWGGFARLDTFGDTRQSIASTADGACLYYPKKCECDENNCDINARGRFGMTPSVSRMWFKTNTTTSSDIALKSHIEFDFRGSCGEVLGLLLLRHAYVKAEWPKVSLLAGQYFHPIYVEGCKPMCVSYHGGCPIEIYARSPQITLQYHPSSFNLIATAYSQLIYQDSGPDGLSVRYIQNSCLPGFYIAAEIRKEHFIAGLGFNTRRLLPALSCTTTSTSEPTKTYVNNSHVTSFMGTAYATIKINDYTFENKIIVGSGSLDFLTIGGYAVSCLNTSTGKRTFTPINFAAYWFDGSYEKHKTLAPGIFIGISKIIGSHKPIYLDESGNPIYYGFDSKLDQVFRVAPRIKSSFNNIDIGLEFDYTKAWFGSMNCCGKHPCTYSVGVLRTLMVVCYNF